jgi:hypothetical protein
MLVIHYHNGALGNTIGAMLSCCTEEGSSSFPLFIVGKNLHHFAHNEKFYYIKHPNIDIEYERSIGNKLIYSTSESIFGKLLILMMGLYKFNNQLPEFNKPFLYKQGTGNYGEQIEILSLTLMDKIDLMNQESDIIFDIMWFWEDLNKIEKFLIDCGLTPDKLKIQRFVKQVKKQTKNILIGLKNVLQLPMMCYIIKTTKLKIRFLKQQLLDHYFQLIQKIIIYTC